MIALIDYGAGNLTSVRKALAAIAAPVVIPAAPDALSGVSGIIIPGVGHYGATAALDDTWRRGIARAVDAGVPLLGICLGLQYLFEGSDEALPHVGWNTVELTRRSPLVEGIPTGTSFYFTHSYAAPVTDACVAQTKHSAAFAAIVERERVFGAQFHPEKSGDAGVRVLRNFVEITGSLTRHVTRFTDH
ncbi:MAG: imidazole glycerol phosphate synthase subunit HisH [Acidobacteria bacterium]|nr:MAG: imidazole glycerol phosphate synthase subunit HisH [Acidobacteriota bacterium]